jgi:tetratricopeptide (TPR) repeat protein
VKIFRTWLYFLAFSFILPTIIYAVEGGDGDVFYGTIGSRAVAMGSAYVALSEDSEGVSYNPAGLGFMVQHQVDFFFSRRFQGGDNLQSLTYGGYIPKIIHLGAEFDLLSFGQVERRDSSGNLLGTYHSSNTRYSFAFARLFFGSLSLGGKFSYERFSAGNQKETHFDGGAGFQWRPFADMEEGKLGWLSLSSVFAGSKPLQAGFGASLTCTILSSQLILAGEVDVNSRGVNALRFGAEFNPTSLLYLRAGLDRIHPTFGVGIKAAGISFDYAFSQQPLGQVHSASISYAFGPNLVDIAQKQKRISIWLQEGKYHLQQKNYSLAIDRFESVLSWDGNNKEAKDLLKKAQLELLLQQGQQSLTELNYEQALLDFRQAKSLDPDNRRIDGQIETALEAIRERETDYIQQERVADLYAQAGEQISKGNLYQAQDILLKILDIDPNLKAVNDRLTEVRAAIARPVTSQKTKITDELKATYEKGIAAIDQGRLGEGIGLLEQVYSTAGNYQATVQKLVDGYFYLGMDSYSQGRLTEAISSWKRILALDPGNSQAAKLIDKAQKELSGLK